MVRISAVSYLNTLPFLYGLKNIQPQNFEIDLQLDFPSACAKKLLNNEVDIALIPVASLVSLQNYHLVSEYCIGATDFVKTVLLLSDVPLHEISSIYLDYQSQTSVNLVKILANHYWKINPQWINADIGYEKQIEMQKAGVIIGDRVFFLKRKYQYTFDLAKEWINFTGLPFVFAAWVSKTPVSNEITEYLNRAFEYGTNHIPQVINEYLTLNPKSDIDLYSYYTKNISYLLNDGKMNGMTKFLEFVKTI